MSGSRPRGDAAMPSRAKRFPNPFYVLLLVASTAFVVTIFAYLIAPTVLDQASGVAAAERSTGETSVIEVKGASDPAPRPAAAEPVGSLRLADWLLHYSPTVLTVEITIMAIAAALAMATDHFFAPKRS